MAVCAAPVSALAHAVLRGPFAVAGIFAPLACDPWFAAQASIGDSHPWRSMKILERST